MKKRGLSDIDWIIGSGLFLVSLITIIVFLKPGINPVNTPDSLLNMLEDNFKKEIPTNLSEGGSGVYWTLYETPLYMEAVNLNGENCIKVPFRYDWEISNVDLYELIEDQNDPSIKIKTLTPFYKDGDNIIFKTTLLTSKKGIFMLDYSNSIIYTFRADKSSDGNVYCGIPQIITEPADPGTINFVPEYGVTEKINGIPSLFIDKTWTRADYNYVKTILNYPELKEFSIIVDYTDPKTDFIFEPVKPLDVNVFTRSWSDFILHYNGTREPVKVIVKVW